MFSGKKLEHQNESTSFDRVVEAIEKLTDLDWTRLRKIAGSFLYGTGFGDADELVNETISRTLAGKRKWPPNVEFITFFANAMKSIADGDRNLVYKDEEVSASDLPGHDFDTDSNPMEHFGSDALSPETILITEEVKRLAEEDLKIIEDHFKGNEVVEWILMGIEDELAASEIIEMSGMTRTQYESARKSLLRGLDRLFPGRRKKWAA